MMRKILIALIAFLGITGVNTVIVRGEEPVQKVDKISQYGITWYFEHPVVAGQFITGDWWVIGPVTITKVTPQPGPIEEDKSKVFKSMYGAQATNVDVRMRNGSMIVSTYHSNQGYDSRLKNYAPELSVKFPVTLQPQTSLISTESNGSEMVLCLVNKMMWKSEKKLRLLLKSAAVLTVLDCKPPVDAFRPPYAGINKPIYTFSQVDTSKLLNLKPTAKMPKWEDYERYLQRPWLDHMGSWLHQVQGPSENQVNYGREFCRVTGIAGLMLNTDAPLERKKKLLIGLIQLGIDITGVVDSGRVYKADGGHYAGRKFPVLFAGAMLNDSRMLNVTKLSYFQEDYQTYYGKGWAGQKALWQIVYHTGSKPPHEQKMPTEWNKKEKLFEHYRRLNSQAWPATALTVRLMGLIKEWNHDAYFDYMDRWMSAEDPYSKKRTELKQPERKEQTVNDPFVASMWKQYRLKVPEPNWAGHCQKWIDNKKWVDNPKPSEPSETYVASK